MPFHYLSSSVLKTKLSREMLVQQHNTEWTTATKCCRINHSECLMSVGAEIGQWRGGTEEKQEVDL